jgi:putative FmdB family regulatory protein
MISTVPIYDYRCDHCGHAFSAVQSFNDHALETCPNCGKKPRRLILAPAVVFKGSGWYKTDSRPAQKDSDSGKSDTKEAGTSKDAGASKETKPDAKPETKSEGKAPADTSKPAKSEGKS